MAMLPTSRKIWRCGWDKELQDINRNDGCGQEIYQSDTLKYESGKYMVLNFKDGPGGKRNDPHVCPNRVGSKFHKIEKINRMEYDWHQEHKFCGECLQTFNSYKMPLCPHCFKLECRDCGNLQVWVADKGVHCFQCGGMCSVRQVFRAYERLYGKYEF